MTEFDHGHALLIGVGADLPMTVRDATALYDVLTDPAICAYPRDHVELLTEADAERQSILDALDRLVARTSQHSTVVLYFSGHGLGGAVPRLVTRDFDPADLAATTISGAELTTRLQAIRSKKLLILLDCCHAGSYLGAAAGVTAKSHMPLAAIEELGKGRGRVVLASSRADEYSYLHSDSSYFTEALLEAFTGHAANASDGHVRVLDTALYISRVVPERRDERQHPVLEVWNLSNNFSIGYYAAGNPRPKHLRALREPDAVELDHGVPQLISNQLRALKAVEAERDYLEMKLVDSTDTTTAEAVQRQLAGARKTIAELRGRLGALPEQTHYGRTMTALWTAAGTLLFYTSYNIFAMTQGWPTILWDGLTQLEKKDPLLAVTGLYWCIPIAFVLFGLTRFYLTFDGRYKGLSLPIAFNLPLYSESRLRRYFQTYTFIVFFVLPVLFLGHFFRLMVKGDVYLYDNPSPVIDTWHEHFWPPLFAPSPLEDNYRLHNSIDGFTYFPLFNAWILLIFLAMLAFRFCNLAWRLYLRRPPDSTTEKGLAP